MVCLLAIALHGRSGVQAQGPGIPNRAVPPTDVMRVISRIDVQDGAPFNHSSMIHHRGYWVQVYGDGNDEPQAGIAVYDLSDPYQPQLVAATETNTERLSEQHAVGFNNADGHNYVALLAVGGIEIWDWTDILQPRQLSHLTLPDTSSGYARGVWWLFWQAPYIYVGAASNGIFIVDAGDPARPRLADLGGRPNPIPNQQTGGFRAGPIFAVGNLLVVSSNDGKGYATLDISDPRRPQLLAARRGDSPRAYSSLLNGNRIYAAGIEDSLHILDITDPTDIQDVASVDTGGRGGYLTIQDGFVHLGASSHYVKIDVRDETQPFVVDNATSDLAGRDEDFATVLGNLVIVGDDHGHGSSVIPHQKEPDTSGPMPNMVNPANGAVNQARTSRVGVTFSDQVDLATVNIDTFIVRPQGGQPLQGRYSGQQGIINFTPLLPLQANQLYEVIIPAGGIKDVAGNPVTNTFRSSFDTGTHLEMPITCDIDPPDAVQVGRSVGLEVRIRTDVGAVTTTWDFGDGSLPTAPGPMPTAEHVYHEPGHYALLARVGNEKYSTACASQITIHNPVVPGHPSSSSTILFDPDRALVWNVNPDNDSVSAVNAVTLAKHLEQPVGREPTSLALAPDGSIWVVNRRDASVHVLDGSQGTLLGIITLPRGSEPYGILFTPDRRAGFITLQATGRLLKLNPQSRAVVGSLEVGPTPRDMAASHLDNRLFVTRFLSPDDQGEIIEVDPESMQIVRTFGLAFDPGPDREDGGRGLPNALRSLAISPDGQRLYIPSKKDNIARGLARDGQPLTFESTVRPILSQIDLTTNVENLTARHDFNDRDGPVAVGFSPLGSYAFVVLQGSNAVEVLDVYSGRLVTSIEQTGLAPSGLAFTSDGGKLFIHGYLSRSVLVYDLKDIILPNRDQTADLLAEISVVAQERLSDQVLAGKRLFFNAHDPRMNRDGYISCASCHVDGGHDGRVWDRSDGGEGLRNTIDLFGHGSSGVDHDGRMHWSANFDEVQDFEHDIRTHFGGQGFMSDAAFRDGTRDQPLGDAKAGISRELDALAAYVASLDTPLPSPYRQPDGSFTPDALAGLRIFLQSGCGVCHGGERYTDSASQLLHDVGTLKATSGHRLGQSLRGLDTPSLAGLWRSAPYLHDGSVASLRELLMGRDGLEPHGLPFPPQPFQVDRLVSFLRQIEAGDPPLTPSIPAIVVVTPVAGAIHKYGYPLRIGVDTTTSGLGAVEKIEFYANGQLLGEDGVPVYAMTWSDPPLGDHVIVARLRYANGFSTWAAEVPIRVEP